MILVIKIAFLWVKPTQKTYSFRNFKGLNINRNTSRADRNTVCTSSARMAVVGCVHVPHTIAFNVFYTAHSLSHGTVSNLCVFKVSKPTIHLTSPSCFQTGPGCHGRTNHL